MSDKSSIFQKVREQAKKISHLGAKSATKLAKEPVEKFKVTPHSGAVLEGQVSQRDTFDLDYQDIQQLFRHQFPSMTRQVFGKRYNTLNKVSRFVLPNGMDQAADEVLELLAEFASNIAATERVLAETGCKEIQELQKDSKRSQRAGHALKEVNKVIAAVQGAVSGMTGLIGAAADLPLSVILSLKTIYEIGHVYGFELDNEEDQRAVYHALAQADLSLIAEKQTIFLGLRSLKSIFNTGDYSQLQSFLSSNYSLEQFNTLITDTDGNYKWSGLNLLNKLNLLRFATPVIGGAIGAVYNIKLIDEVASHADEIFSYARQYLKDQQRDDLSVLEAYQLAKSQQAAVAALEANDINQLLDQESLLAATTDAATALQQDHAIQHLEQNDAIVDVKIKARKNATETEAVPVEQKIQQGIEALAKENGVAEQTATQQPALKAVEENIDDRVEEGFEEHFDKNQSALNEDKSATKPKTVRRKTAAKTNTKPNAAQSGSEGQAAAASVNTQAVNTHNTNKQSTKKPASSTKTNTRSSSKAATSNASTTKTTPAKRTPRSKVVKDESNKE